MSLTKKSTPKKKNPQPTIAKKKQNKQDTSTRTVDPDWRHKYTFWNQKQIPDAALSDLAEHLRDWVNSEEEIMVFGEFLKKYKIARCSMEDFLKRSENLRKAKSYAMYTIGVNREKASLYRKIDHNTFKVRQHQYDPDWALAEVRNQKLKNTIDANAVTKDDLKDIVNDILKPIDEK